MSQARAPFGEFKPGLRNSAPNRLAQNAEGDPALAFFHIPCPPKGLRRCARLSEHDLDRIAEALEPFSDRTLSKFAEFLIKAHEFEQTGAVSNGRRSIRKPLDPQVVDREVDSLNSLYERATSPELTYQKIDAEIDRLNKQFKKDVIVEIAARFGVPGKTKVACIEAIYRKIKDRKESFERTRF